MGALNKFMLGSDEFFSAMLSQDDVNLEKDSGSWLSENIEEEAKVKIPETYMDEKSFLVDASEYQIPNMLYSPENIFANNIAILDVNFLNPNKYSPIITEGEAAEQAEKMAQSAAAGTLQKTIASWYKSFRNIAIVALLSMLVYLGIRILISSTAGDKAKYKESLKNWLVALCLVFVIHFIMSGIIMLTENFNKLFSQEIDEGILVEATPSDESTGNATVGDKQKIKFRTNLIGLARFKAQADAWQDAAAYTLVYLALVIYTIIFTVMYFKRFLYMAFFTMIAPLVALTYPIDKVGDGKAQAFNIWFKEYTMNAILQPVHLILYSVFVNSAIDLATDNPIYAIVAILFLIPAEKFIKKMFGMDKAESAGGFGSFAGGALAMKGMEKLAKLGGNNSGKSSGGNGTNSSEKDKKVFFNKTNSSASNLGVFNNGDEERQGIGSTVMDMQDNDNNAEGRERTRLDNLNDDRAEWERIANDQNASDLDREEARQQMGLIDEDIERERANQQLSQPPEEQLMESQINQPDIPEEQDPEKWAKLKTGWKYTKTVGKIAGAKAWKGARFTGRILAKTAGTVGGATVGLAAGLTTGDMSKALSFAATGAAAGGLIGSNIANAPGKIYSGTKNIINNSKDSWGDVKYNYNKGIHGYEEARTRKMARENNIARKQFYRNKEERAKVEDLAGKIGFKGNIKDLMDAKIDYLEAGIDDEKLINNSIKATYEQGNSLGGQAHKENISLAAMINEGGYNARDIRNEEERDRIEQVVQSQVNGTNNQRIVMTRLADLLGEKNFYEDQARQGHTRIKPETPITRRRQSTTRNNNRESENNTRPEPPPRMNTANQ